MAPEETSTIRRPAAPWPASTSTSASSRSAASPPAAVVREDEPTFTTTSRAAVTSSRTRPFCGAAAPAPRRDPISCDL